MLRRLLGLSAAALVLLLCVPAAAQDDEEEEIDWQRTAWYLAFQGVGGISNFQQAGLGDPRKNPPDVDAESYDHSGGFNVRVGYRSNEIFALEAEYELLDSWSGDGDKATTGVLTVNTKVPFFNSRYQPYLIYGLGAFWGTLDPVGENNSSFVDFTMRFGAGIDVYLDDHWGMSLESDYVYPFGDSEFFRYYRFAAGLNYRF